MVQVGISHVKTNCCDMCTAFCSHRVSVVLLFQALEQKVYKLQEELTDLHRRKGENAQQLVELNQCLQERDKVLATKENK